MKYLFENLSKSLKSYAHLKSTCGGNYSTYCTYFCWSWITTRLDIRPLAKLKQLRIGPRASKLGPQIFVEMAIEKDRINLTRYITSLHWRWAQYLSAKQGKYLSDYMASKPLDSLHSERLRCENLKLHVEKFIIMNTE